MTARPRDRIAVIDDDADFSRRARAEIETLMATEPGSWDMRFERVVTTYDFTGASVRGPNVQNIRNLIEQLVLLAEVVREDGTAAGAAFISDRLVPTVLFCDAYMPDLTSPQPTTVNTTALAERIRTLVADVHDAWEAAGGNPHRCPMRVQFWSREWEELETAPRRHRLLIHDPDTDVRYPWAHYSVKPRFDLGEEEREFGWRRIGLHLRGKQQLEPDLPEALFAGDHGAEVLVELAAACQLGVAIIICDDATARQQAVRRALRNLPPGRKLRTPADPSCAGFLEALEQLEDAPRSVLEAELPPRPDLGDPARLRLIVRTVRNLCDKHGFVLHMRETGNWTAAMSEHLQRCIVKIPEPGERAEDLPDLVKAVTGRRLNDEAAARLVTYAPALRYSAIFDLQRAQSSKQRFGTEDDWRVLGIDTRVVQIKLKMSSGKSGAKASFTVATADGSEVAVAATQRSFFATMCLIEMADAPRSPDHVVRLRFSALKKRAEDIKRADRTAWSQDEVRSPLFDEPGRLMRVEFPKDTSRIKAALEKLFEGLPPLVHSVTKEYEMLKIRFNVPVNVVLEGVPGRERR